MPLRLTAKGREHKRGKRSRWGSSHSDHERMGRTPPRKFGGATRHNTRRENRLEELGRVDAEKAYTSKGKRNLREEKSRIRKELAKGGEVSPKRKAKRGQTKGGYGHWWTATDPKKPWRSVHQETLDKKLRPMRKKGIKSGTRHGRGLTPQERWEYIPESWKAKTGGRAPSKAKGFGPAAASKVPILGIGSLGSRKKIKTHGGGQDALSTARKVMGKRISNKRGGTIKGPNRPRPTGPHMWVRGDKRKKYAVGSVVKGAIKGAKKIAKGLGSGIKPSEAKDVLKTPGKSWKKTRSQYLKEHSPHFGGTRKKYASGGVVMAGKKVGCQIK